MKGLRLLILVVAFGLCGSARASPSDPTLSQEIPTILAMAAENIDLGRGPKGWDEPVRTPALASVRDGVFQIIADEGLKSQVAFQFLTTVLLAGPDAPVVFRDRVLAIIDSLDLTYDQKEAILELVHGRPSEVHSLTSGTALKRVLPRNVTVDDGPGEIFGELQSMLRGLPGIFPGKQKLLGAVELIHDLIIPSDENCYTTDPVCAWTSNQGIVEHLSRLLSTDEELLLDSLRFYARLDLFDLQYPHAGDFSVFDQAPGGDVWNMALSSVSGDARRALRVLEIYGHDDCCNGVSYTGQAVPELSGFLNLLNAISPSAFHGDAPSSLLQAPGSLAGIRVSGPLQKKFNKLLARYDALKIPRPTFGAGYHHVYGGVLTADELIRAGFGKTDELKLAVFLSEGLGYFYKKFTFPLWLGSDANVLWEQIGHNERKKPSCPAGWDSARFAAAKLDLDAGILTVTLSREEHKAGADFAFHALLDAQP